MSSCDTVFAETTARVSPSNIELMKPGAFLVLLTRVPLKGLKARQLGLELRDTILIGSMFAFIFRKPLEESTVAKQIVKTGTGALNIDICRVGCDQSEFFSKTGNPRSGKGHAKGFGIEGTYGGDKANPPNSQGRWPSNLVLLHQEGCKRVGERKVKAPVINRFKDGMKPFGEGAGHKYESVQTGDSEGNESIPIWECAEGCSVRALDLQNEETSRFFPQIQTMTEVRAWLIALTNPKNGLVGF